MQLWRVGGVKQWVPTGGMYDADVRDRVGVRRVVYGHRPWTNKGIILPWGLCGQSAADLQLWCVGRIKQWVCAGELPDRGIGYRLRINRGIHRDRAWADEGFVMSWGVYREPAEDL
jgi:hypothetical protein